MKIIITEEQYNSLNEMIKLDIKVGDTLMGGKFKNKKIVVKTIGKNDKGDITINGKPLLRFRLLKEDISTEKGIEMFKKWLHTMYGEISYIETNKTYDGHPLIQIYYTTDNNSGNYSSWLAMDIKEKWDAITGGLMPTQPVWYSKVPDNVKFLITTEDLDLYNDEDDTINENDKSKVVDKKVIDKYIKHVAPQLSPENIRFVMSPSEDGVNIYVIDTEKFNLNSKLVGFFDNDYGTDDRRLFLEPRYYKLFKVFGDNPELILGWFNRTYESKLKQMFNEIDWEVNSISIVK
jgi:hypothetical protein